VLQEKNKGSGTGCSCALEASLTGYNATKMNNFIGTMSPAEGCKIINVQTAMENEGRTGVFLRRTVTWAGEFGRGRPSKKDRKCDLTHLKGVNLCSTLLQPRDSKIPCAKSSSDLTRLDFCLY
jgi:hypothetical protein